MRWTIVILACAVLVAVALRPSTSRSETTESANVTAEPITGSAVPPRPGDDAPTRDPQTPYGIGPRPLAEWPYETLNEQERAVADRGRTDDFTAAHAGFSAAARQRSAEARAEGAAAQLGIDDLAAGVVP